MGEWEVDMVIGAGHKGVLLPGVDRMSMYMLFRMVMRNTAALVGEALVAMLEQFEALILTLAAYSGKKFADHREIAAALSAEVCFVRPNHSAERDFNEHTIGLLRRCFSKSEGLLGIDPGNVRIVTRVLNGRPRKAINYRTPAPVFAETLAAA